MLLLMKIMMMMMTTTTKTMLVVAADDCFQLGTIAYFRDDHYHAVLWLTEALKINSEEKEKTVSRSQILDYLSFSIWKVSGGMIDSTDSVQSSISIKH